MTTPFDAAGPAFSQLRRLTEISRALTYTTSIEQVTRLAVERGAEILDASASVLMLADPDGLLQVRASHGVAEERVARFRAPLDDELMERLQGLLDVPGQCFVAVPLVVAGAVTGLLAVALRREPSPADEALLSALADQAAVAVENARLTGEVRIEMEAQLRAVRSATDAKDRALATLAHDIRTPLSAIEGYCGIMQDGMQGPINDRQRETLGRVRMSGRHLLSLLENVMEMARLSAGVVRLRNEPVRLSIVAREALQLLVPAAEARLVSLRPGPLPELTVTTDHDRLRQVLVNLIGNAVKFTPADGSVVVSTAEIDVGAQRWGEIRVTDSGPGIPEEERASIFEPYYRSPGTETAPGIGLGLAISHGLIQHMGGELAVESEVGKGSSFTVRLPLRGAG
jgi:signal transduction histidine kinase